MTPTPIPIDSVPSEFKTYIFDFFKDILLSFKQMQIPFTPVTVFDVLVGTIIVSAVTGAIFIIYGKGDSKKHE